MRDRSSPTLTLVLLVLVVAAVQTVLWVVGVNPWVFALQWPLDREAWTLVTSVFAHAGPQHLLSNLVGLALVGFFLERRTSPGRFYAFFLLTGMLTGATQVAVAVLVFGQQGAGVLGASGAVFALFGYVLTSNRLTRVVAGGVEISPAAQILLLIGVAVVLTFVSRGENVALIAHFTGLLLGLVAGREHLLRQSSDPGSGV